MFGKIKIKRTDQERDRIEQVSNDQLERQRVDPKSSANPGQEPVYRSNERQNRKHVRPKENRQHDPPTLNRTTLTKSAPQQSTQTSPLY
jgi:hypothetical protein